RKPVWSAPECGGCCWQCLRPEGSPAPSPPVTDCSCLPVPDKEVVEAAYCPQCCSASKFSPTAGLPDAVLPDHKAPDQSPAVVPAADQQPDAQPPAPAPGRYGNGLHSPTGC